MSLLSSLGLFNKNELPILNEFIDYVLLPDENDTISYIVRIEKGDYLGVCYKYKTVYIKEEGSFFNKHAKIGFTYDIIKQPENIIVDMDDFENHIGKILHSIMTNVASSGKYEKEQVRIKETNIENRDSGFTEFDIK